MTTYAMRTSELAQRPDDRDDRQDRDDHTGQRRDPADDDLQKEDRRQDQDNEGDETGDDARTSFLLHASIVDPLEVRVAIFAARPLVGLELEAREAVAADL